MQQIKMLLFLAIIVLININILSNRSQKSGEQILAKAQYWLVRGIGVKTFLKNTIPAIQLSVTSYQCSIDNCLLF